MPQYSVELANARLSQYATVIGNGGKMEIYSGTDADLTGTANAEGTLLAVFTLGSPFAAAPANKVVSPTLPADTVGVSAGTAAWARITKADGSTAVVDLTVGGAGSGKEVILANTAITVGGAVQLTGFTITHP